jgi:hypothetical protein
MWQLLVRMPLSLEEPRQKQQNPPGDMHLLRCRILYPPRNRRVSRNPKEDPAPLCNNSQL